MDKCNNPHNHGTVIENEADVPLMKAVESMRVIDYNLEPVDATNGDGEKVEAVMDEILNELACFSKCNNTLNCGTLSWTLRLHEI